MGGFVSKQTKEKHCSFYVRLTTVPTAAMEADIAREARLKLSDTLQSAHQPKKLWIDYSFSMPDLEVLSPCIVVLAFGDLSPLVARRWFWHWFSSLVECRS